MKLIEMIQEIFNFKSDDIPINVYFASECEEILKQIEEYQEKAEKWDRYYDPDKWLSMEEENKQLKEESESQSRVQKSSDEYIDNLKQKLEKETIWHDEAEHIIEKITTLFERWGEGNINALVFYDELKDILGEKE